MKSAALAVMLVASVAGWPDIDLKPPNLMMIEA